MAKNEEMQGQAFSCSYSSLTKRSHYNNFFFTLYRLGILIM